MTKIIERKKLHSKSKIEIYCFAIFFFQGLREEFQASRRSVQLFIKNVKLFKSYFFIYFSFFWGGQMFHPVSGSGLRIRIYKPKWIYRSNPDPHSFRYRDFGSRRATKAAQNTKEASDLGGKMFVNKKYNFVSPKNYFNFWSCGLDPYTHCDKIRILNHAMGGFKTLLSVFTNCSGCQGQWPCWLGPSRVNCYYLELRYCDGS